VRSGKQELCDTVVALAAWRVHAQATSAASGSVLWVWQVPNWWQMSRCARGTDRELISVSHPFVFFLAEHRARTEQDIAGQ
jgi:hypothetical protein